MAPNMKRFLSEAAEAEPGKGIILERHHRRIAGRAVSLGYGMTLESAFAVFIISDEGRAALAAA